MWYIEGMEAQAETFRMSVQEGCELLELIYSNVPLNFVVRSPHFLEERDAFLSGKTALQYQGKTFRVVPDLPVARARAFAVEERPVWWERDEG